MTTVAEEDPSRVIWPASPSQGQPTSNRSWINPSPEILVSIKCRNVFLKDCVDHRWASGVDRLSGHPNGRPLVNQKWCGRLGCEDTKELHGPYLGDGGGLPTDAGSMPPAMAAAMPGGGRSMRSPIGAPVNLSAFATASMPPQLQIPADYTPKASPTNQDSSDGHNFTQVSPGSTGYFVSEFGVTGMASFESLAPSFAAEHWGVHTQPWRFRNHMPDSMGFSYFGANRAVFDRVGKAELQAQLYMSMVGQALFYSSMLAEFRSTNIHGSITWDLGEIWPCGGWGSLEYGSDAPGALAGGRWKPSHYALKHAFADVITSCGWSAGELRCYLRNDSPWAMDSAIVSVSLMHLSGGGLSNTSQWLTPLVQFGTAIPSVGDTPASAPSNGLIWFCPTRTGGPTGQLPSCSNHSTTSKGGSLSEHGCGANGTDCVLNITVVNGHDDVPLAENLLALALPKDLHIQPTAVSAKVVRSFGNATCADPITCGNATIAVRSSLAVACWVVLTSAAAG